MSVGCLLSVLRMSGLIFNLLPPSTPQCKDLVPSKCRRCTVSQNSRSSPPWCLATAAPSQQQGCRCGSTPELPCLPACGMLEPAGGRQGCSPRRWPGHARAELVLCCSMRDPMAPCTGCCSPVPVRLSTGLRLPTACTSAHAHHICNLQVFSSLIALRRLTVNNCPRVGDNGMQVLRHLPQLTHLNLCGCIKVRQLGISGRRPAARQQCPVRNLCLRHSSLWLWLRLFMVHLSLGPLYRPCSTCLHPCGCPACCSVCKISWYIIASACCNRCRLKGRLQAWASPAACLNCHSACCSVLAGTPQAHQLGSKTALSAQDPRHVCLLQYVRLWRAVIRLPWLDF